MKFILKKITIVVAVAIIFLGGCNSEVQTSTDGSVRMAESLPPSAGLETLSFVIKGANLFLMDVLTHERLAEFSLPDEEMMFWGTQQLKNGYQNVFLCFRR